MLEINNQYLGKVSCIKCGYINTKKAVFCHFRFKHDDAGIISQKQGGIVNAALTRKPLHECANPMCQLLTKSKFCSKSCSATVANALRSPSARQQQGATLLANKIASGWTPKQVLPKAKPIRNRTCKQCGQVEETTGRFQSEYCKFCSPSLTYRRACKFTFSLRQYPAEFDFTLLDTHGMFHPTTNPKGVSRDHMLSVNEGKKLRMSPETLAHPANCEIMLQGDNTRKQGQSSISVDELMQRIEDWDAKYGCGGRT